MCKYFSSLSACVSVKCHCFFSCRLYTHAKRLQTANPSARVIGLIGNFVFSLSGIASTLEWENFPLGEQVQKEKYVKVQFSGWDFFFYPS